MTSRPRPHLYILGPDDEPIVVEDFLAWAEWFQHADRQLARTDVGDVRVSTIFLGLDNGFGGPPWLWETMIFGGPHDRYQHRYRSRAEALVGHDHAVMLARGTVE